MPTYKPVQTWQEFIVLQTAYVCVVNVTKSLTMIIHQAGLLGSDVAAGIVHSLIFQRDSSSQFYFLTYMKADKSYVKGQKIDIEFYIRFELS